jgi:hypothetical protein
VGSGWDLYYAKKPREKKGLVTSIKAKRKEFLV